MTLCATTHTHNYMFWSAYDHSQQRAYVWIAFCGLWKYMQLIGGDEMLEGTEVEEDLGQLMTDNSH